MSEFEQSAVDDIDSMEGTMPVHAKYEGVLFKRRDIFKKKWRPRLFVLDGEAGTLTYYLLTSEAAEAVEASHHSELESSPTATMTHTNILQQQQQQQQDVEYDVVPRGIVSLVNGCTVRMANDESSPDSQLFCFTIAPLDRSNATAVHLASTTAEGRSEWIQRIAQVCSGSATPKETTTTTTATPAILTSPSSQEEQGYASESTSVVMPSLIDQHDQTTQDETERTKDDDNSAGVIGPIHENCQNLPPSLAHRIETLLNQNLPLCLEQCEDRHGWKTLFENKKGVSAYQSSREFQIKGHVGDGGNETTIKNLPMVKSVARLDGIHPRQVLNLIMDPSKRVRYETTIDMAQRLRTMNPVTFVDYYCAKAVWPTTPRDFLVTLHCRVLSSGAIVLLAFSDPQNNNVSPPKDTHVRGTLVVSLYHLEPIHSRTIDNQEEDGTVLRDIVSCQLTRLLCVDLGGNLPSSVVSAVSQQQAMLPYSIQQFLNKNEPNPPERLTAQGGPITNDNILRTVLPFIHTEDEAPKLESIANTEPHQENVEHIEPQQGNNSEADNETPTTAGMAKNPSLPNTESLTPEDTTDVDRNNDKVIEVDASKGKTSEVVHVHRRYVFGCCVLTTMACSKYFCTLPPSVVALVPLSIFFLVAFFAALSLRVGRQYLLANETDEPISMFHAAMVALTPILSWELANLCHAPGREVLFLSTAFFAIKTLLSTHLGTPLFPSNASHTILKTGTVTCRFEVDLKGVVRFIGNKKEEREEQQEGLHDGDDQVANVAVTHIVVKAVALALSELQVLNCTRINIPLLGVDNYYPNSSVSVSVDMNNHASQFPTTSDIITLHDVSKLPVGNIAHQLTKKDTSTASTGSEAQQKTGRLSMLVYSLLNAVLGQYVAEKLMSGDECMDGPMLGNCLVFTTPDSENNQVDIDVAPAPSHSSPSIVVVIGGIRVKKIPLSSKHNMLTMSIVLDCPAATVATCRQFSERVQHLVQFPELCETD